MNEPAYSLGIWTLDSGGDTVDRILRRKWPYTVLRIIGADTSKKRACPLTFFHLLILFALPPIRWVTLIISYDLFAPCLNGTMHIFLPFNIVDHFSINLLFRFPFSFGYPVDKFPPFCNVNSVNYLPS